MEAYQLIEHLSGNRKGLQLTVRGRRRYRMIPTVSDLQLQNDDGYSTVKNSIIVKFTALQHIGMNVSYIEAQQREGS